jgi:cytochrome c biogenesis protein CcdA
MLALALSFGAGLLTALSPCVLPALPIIVGSAAAARRHGGRDTTVKAPRDLPRAPAGRELNVLVPRTV